MEMEMEMEIWSNELWSLNACHHVILQPCE